MLRKIRSFILFRLQDNIKDKEESGSRRLLRLTFFFVPYGKNITTSVWNVSRRYFSLFHVRRKLASVAFRFQTLPSSKVELMEEE